MGDTAVFQPLTREDRISVLLYRTGIVLSTIFLVTGAVLAIATSGAHDMRGIRPPLSGLAANILILSLYFSTGLSVFFIHLYIGKFHRVLKKIYYGAVVCLALLFLTGRGNPASTMFGAMPVGALLLIPLSCCLGFIAAKEAFCFRLLEGYLLALIMPAYLLVYGMGLIDRKQAAYGLALVALMHVFFMLRKAFMPLHFDIGDKSAYQP
ncbi:MAG TPA: DUF2301 domain-containing membrane protein [Thermodesulfovibrionales bacterium]|nr:DUF2301 domain-containing membrane protein [Thermodesulfovibrionales bacterium]